MVTMDARSNNTGVTDFDTKLEVVVIPVAHVDRDEDCYAVRGELDDAGWYLVQPPSETAAVNRSDHLALRTPRSLDAPASGAAQGSAVSRQTEPSWVPWRVPWELHPARRWGHVRSEQVPPGAAGRSVRLVAGARPNYPSEWAATSSVAVKLGTSAETVRKWIRRAQVDTGQRPGITSEEHAEIKRLRREVARAGPGQ